MVMVRQHWNSEEMEALGVIHNDITFIGALHACSHSGLWQEGKILFHKMVHEFGFIPKVEHYGCIWISSCCMQASQEYQTWGMGSH